MAVRGATGNSVRRRDFSRPGAICRGIFCFPGCAFPHSVRLSHASGRTGTVVHRFGTAPDPARIAPQRCAGRAGRRIRHIGVGAVGMWLYFQTTNNHFGAVLFGLLGTMLALRLARQSSWPHALALLVVVGAASVSSRLFVLTFTLPCLAVAGMALLLTRRSERSDWRQQRTATLARLVAVLAGGQALAMLLEHLLIHHIPVEARPPLSVESISASLTFLTKATVAAFDHDNVATLLLALMLSGCLLYLLYLLLEPKNPSRSLPPPLTRRSGPMPLNAISRPSAPCSAFPCRSPLPAPCSPARSSTMQVTAIWHFLSCLRYCWLSFMPTDARAAPGGRTGRGQFAPRSLLATRPGLGIRRHSVATRPLPSRSASPQPAQKVSRCKPALPITGMRVQ